MQIDKDWVFTPGKHIVSSDKSGGIHVDLPFFWNDSIIHGTFSKTVDISSLEMGELAISVENIHSSYRLFIDNQLIGQVGDINLDPTKQKPSRKPMIYRLGNPKNDHVLVDIQVTNLYHYNGGVKGDIIIGDYEHLEAKIFQNHAVIIGVSGAYALIAITLIIGYFMFTYRIQRIRGELLSFALFSLAISYLMMASGRTPIYRFFPDLTFYASIRLEHSAFYLAGLFGINYFYYLFPSVVKKKYTDAFSIVSIGGVCATWLLPVYYALPLENFYLIFGVVAIFYASGVIYKAVKSRERSAIFLSGALSVMFVIALIEVLLRFFNAPQNNYLDAISYFIFAVVNVVALIDRFIVGYKFFSEQKVFSKTSKNQKLLMSMVAHEVKTPLSQLKLNAEMIHILNDLGDTAKFDAKLPGILRNFNKSIDRLNNMITDLMHFVSQDTINKENIDIREVIESVNKIPTIKISDYTDDKSILIHSNKTVLEYLIITLANSSKHLVTDHSMTPHVVFSKNKDIIFVSISIEGEGLPPILLEELRKPFYKMNLRKDDADLGFYIVKNLIERLEHNLHISSSDDDGTIFTISIDTIR